MTGVSMKRLKRKFFKTLETDYNGNTTYPKPMGYSKSSPSLLDSSGPPTSAPKVLGRWDYRHEPPCPDTFIYVFFFFFEAHSVTQAGV